MSPDGSITTVVPRGEQVRSADPSMIGEVPDEYKVGDDKPDWEGHPVVPVRMNIVSVNALTLKGAPSVRCRGNSF